MKTMITVLAGLIAVMCSGCSTLGTVLQGMGNGLAQGSQRQVQQNQNCEVEHLAGYDQLHCQ